MPSICKFRPRERRRGPKPDIIVYAEWKHPDIKEEDIQHAFKSLAEIIEREHKEKGVITKNYQRLITVVTTQSECDSTVTSELLSNYEQFCRTIVKQYTVEGAQYVKKHKFWYLLNHAYQGNPYQSVKQDGEWHNSHQTHVQNMRIVRNARTHDQNLKFLADENNNYHFLLLELEALVLLNFDLSKGKGLKYNEPEDGPTKPDEVIGVEPKPKKPKKPLDELKTFCSKNWKMIAAAAAVMLLLVIAVPAMLPGNGTKKEQAVQTSPTMMPSLEGFYYLKVTNGDTQEGTLRTCQVREYGNNTARVLVTSDYDPEVYEFTYSDDGTLYSRDMGSGKMTYNKRLDRIVLTFKKDDTTWEFTN